MLPTHHCRTCGAEWTAGRFTPGCDECGGGAMDRDCPQCGGRCGQRWRRAVVDSGDAALAHWVGRCGQRGDGAGATEIVGAEWWLDSSALPDLYWARLLPTSGAWTVRDMDRIEHRFQSRDAAVAWLSEEEYEPLDVLRQDGEVLESTVPPAEF